MSVKVITEKTIFAGNMVVCIKNPSELPDKSIITIRKFSEVVGILRKNCFPIYNLRQDKEI